MKVPAFVIVATIFEAVGDAVASHTIVGLLLGGTFIVAGAAIIYFWK